MDWCCTTSFSMFDIFVISRDSVNWKATFSPSFIYSVRGFVPTWIIQFRWLSPLHLLSIFSKRNLLSVAYLLHRRYRHGPSAVRSSPSVKLRMNSRSSRSRVISCRKMSNVNGIGGVLNCEVHFLSIWPACSQRSSLRWPRPRCVYWRYQRSTRIMWWSKRNSWRWPSTF